MNFSPLRGEIPLSTLPLQNPLNTGGNKRPSSFEEEGRLSKRVCVSSAPSLASVSPRWRDVAQTQIHFGRELQEVSLQQPASTVIEHLRQDIANKKAMEKTLKEGLSIAQSILLLHLLVAGSPIQEGVSEAQSRVNHLSESTIFSIVQTYTQLSNNCINISKGFGDSHSPLILSNDGMSFMRALQNIELAQGNTSPFLQAAGTLVSSLILRERLISQSRQRENLEISQIYLQLLKQIGLIQVPSSAAPPIGVTTSPTTTQALTLPLNPDLSHIPPAEDFEERRCLLFHHLGTSLAHLYYFLKITAEKIDVSDIGKREIKAVVKMFGVRENHLSHLIEYTQLTNLFFTKIMIENFKFNRNFKKGKKGYLICFTYFIFNEWINSSSSLEYFVYKCRNNIEYCNTLNKKIYNKFKIEINQLKEKNLIEGIIKEFIITSGNEKKYSYAFVAMIYVMAQKSCPLYEKESDYHNFINKLCKKLENEEELFSPFFIDQKFLQSKGIERPLSWYITDCQHIPYSTVLEQIYDQAKLIINYPTIRNDKNECDKLEQKYGIKRSNLENQWHISICMNFSEGQHSTSDNLYHQASVDKAKGAIWGWLKKNISLSEYWLSRKDIGPQDMIRYVACALANQNLEATIRQSIINACQKYEIHRLGGSIFNDPMPTRRSMALPHPSHYTADLIARYLLEFRQERKSDPDLSSGHFAKQKGISKCSFNHWVTKKQWMQEAYKDTLLNPSDKLGSEARHWIQRIRAWIQVNVSGHYPISDFCKKYLNKDMIKEASFHIWTGAFLATPTVSNAQKLFKGRLWQQLAKEGYYQGDDSSKRLANIATLFLEEELDIRRKQRNVEESLSSLESKSLKELQEIPLPPSIPTHIESSISLCVNDITSPGPIDEFMEKDINQIDDLLQNIKINLNNLQEHIDKEKIILHNRLSDVLNHRILFLIKQERAVVKLFLTKDTKFLFDHLKDTMLNRPQNRIEYYFQYKEKEFVNKIDLKSEEIFERFIKKEKFNTIEKSYTKKTATTLLPSESQYMEVFVGTKEIKIGVIFDYNNCDAKKERYFFKEDTHSNLCFWIDVKEVQQKYPHAKPLFFGGIQGTILKEKHLSVTLEDILRINRMAVEQRITIKWNELLLGLPQKKCEALFSPRDTLPYRLATLQMMFFVKDILEFTVDIPIMIIATGSPPQIYSEKSRIEDFISAFQFGENSCFYRLLSEKDFEFSKQIITNYLDSTCREVTSLKSNTIANQKMYSEEFLSRFFSLLKTTPSFSDIENFLIGHLYTVEVIFTTLRSKEKSFASLLLSNEDFNFLKKAIQYHLQTAAKSERNDSYSKEFLEEFLSVLGDSPPSPKLIQTFLKKKRKEDLFGKFPNTTTLLASTNMKLNAEFKEKAIINAFNSPLEVGVILENNDQILVVNEYFLTTKLLNAGIEIERHGNKKNICLPFTSLSKDQTQDIPAIHTLANKILKQLGLTIFLMSHWGDFQYWDNGGREYKRRYYRAKLVSDSNKYEDQENIMWVNKRELNRYVNLFNIKGKCKSSEPPELDLPRENKPLLHPKLLEGRRTQRELTLHFPSVSTDKEAWSDHLKRATLAAQDMNKEDMLPLEINKVRFNANWNPPKSLEEWKGFMMKHLKTRFEDKVVPFHAMRLCAGVIIQEPKPDGRVWMVAPSNKYGGYDAVFPKGTVEPGFNCLLTAFKEGREECGLEFKIKKVLFDLERPGGQYLRMYLAKRRGGHPKLADAENQAILLVRPEDVNTYYKII